MADLDDIAWELPLVRKPGVGTLSSPAPGPFLTEDRWGTAYREWELAAEQMTDAEATSLQTAWDDARGVGTVAFTPPGESAIEVEFIEDALDLERVAHDHWRANVPVREVP